MEVESEPYGRKRDDAPSPMYAFCMHISKACILLSSGGEGARLSNEKKSKRRNDSDGPVQC